jgi:cyclophilin family peptidyl-prolyl cis-trans isomerase
MCIDPAKTYTATLVTTKGTMTVALDAKAAPKTVNNFVVLARYHFYDGIAFHRIIPGFMDQTGDPQATGAGGPGYQFADELPAAGQYKIGSLAMANSGANTNGSQFFIITGQQGLDLQPQFSLFGQVTSGLDVAQAINGLGTNDQQGRPKAVVKITSITIAES